MTAIYTARDSVLALVLERFGGQFDFSSLSNAQRTTALRELAALRPTIAHGSARLASALARFEHKLRVTKSRQVGIGSASLWRMNTSGPRSIPIRAAVQAIGSWSGSPR